MCESSGDRSPQQLDGFSLEILAPESRAQFQARSILTMFIELLEASDRGVALAGFVDCLYKVQKHTVDAIMTDTLRTQIKEIHCLTHEGAYDDETIVHVVKSVRDPLHQLGRACTKGLTGQMMLARCDLRRVQIAKNAEYKREMESLEIPDVVAIAEGDEFILPNSSHWETVFRMMQKISRRASADFKSNDVSYSHAMKTLENVRESLFQAQHALQVRDVERFSALLAENQFNAKKVIDLTDALGLLQASMPSAVDVKLTSITEPGDKHVQSYENFRSHAQGHLRQIYNAALSICDTAKKHDSTAVTTVVELANDADLKIECAPVFQNLVAQLREQHSFNLRVEVNRLLRPGFTRVWKLLFGDSHCPKGILDKVSLVDVIVEDATCFSLILSNIAWAIPEAGACVVFDGVSMDLVSIIFTLKIFDILKLLAAMPLKGDARLHCITKVESLINEDDNIRDSLKQKNQIAKIVAQIDTLYEQLSVMVSKHQQSIIAESAEELNDTLEAAIGFHGLLEVLEFLTLAKSCGVTAADMKRAGQILTLEGSGTKFVQAFMLCEASHSRMKDLFKKLKVTLDPSFSDRLEELRTSWATLAFAQTMSRPLSDGVSRETILRRFASVVPVSSMLQSLQDILYSEAPGLKPMAFTG